MSPQLTRVLFGLSLASGALVAQAAPALNARQDITALSTSQISAFKPYSFFASAGYCQPAATLAWNCGTNCQGNPGFVPLASGGDGDAVQFWYVGYDPSLQTVIVSHQGTDPTEIESLLTDSKIIKVTLDPTLFPGMDSSIEVHKGFAEAQASTAQQVLSAVQTALSQFGANHVTTVGHSLGAAIAVLDAVFLPLHLSGVTFKTVGYGLPRVGNQAFADYVDAHVQNLNHINNKEDFVPIIPGEFLGFVHPSGEIHIQDSGEWTNCPGQDNSSDQCIAGDVSEVFDGEESDHDGPYDGVKMGC